MNSRISEKTILLQPDSSCNHFQLNALISVADLLGMPSILVVCRKSPIILLLTAVGGIFGKQLSFTGYVCKLRSVANAGDRLVFNFSVKFRLVMMIFVKETRFSSLQICFDW